MCKILAGPMCKILDMILPKIVFGPTCFFNLCLAWVAKPIVQNTDGPNVQNTDEPNAQNTGELNAHNICEPKGQNTARSKYGG